MPSFDICQANIKRSLPFLIAIALCGIVFQNCTPSDSSKPAILPAVVENPSAFENEGGGHGSGYDGKLYVSPGSCYDGSKIAHEIQISKDRKQVYLKRWNCKLLQPPESLNPNALVYQGSNYQQFIYADAIFYQSEIYAASKVSSCREIKSLNPESESGEFLIDLDGLGGKLPFSAYCDMSKDGGGWTQIVGPMAVNTSELVACEGKGEAPGRCEISGAKIQLILSNVDNAEVLLHLRQSGVQEILASGHTNLAGWSGTTGMVLLDQQQVRFDDIPCVWGFYCNFDAATNFQKFSLLKSSSTSGRFLKTFSATQGNNQRHNPSFNIGGELNLLMVR